MNGIMAHDCVGIMNVRWKDCAEIQVTALYPERPAVSIG